MPRTMTAEREVEIRDLRNWGYIPDLLAEIDAERAESQRLQSRVEVLEGALKPFAAFDVDWLLKDQHTADSWDTEVRVYILAAQLRQARAALHPEPAAEPSSSRE